MITDDFEGETEAIAPESLARHILAIARPIAIEEARVAVDKHESDWFAIGIGSSIALGVFFAAVYCLWAGVGVGG